jgi:hypothetical protein
MQHVNRHRETGSWDDYSLLVCTVDVLTEFTRSNLDIQESSTLEKQSILRHYGQPLQ